MEKAFVYGMSVYMVMFLDKGAAAPIEYKVDLGGLSNGDV